jgi:hypothetical protein
MLVAPASSKPSPFFGDIFLFFGAGLGAILHLNFIKSTIWKGIDGDVTIHYQFCIYRFPTFIF